MQMSVAQEDLVAAAHPDVNTPFKDKEDAFRRLAPYHVYMSHEPERTGVSTDEAVLDKARAAEDALSTLKKRLEVGLAILLSLMCL